MINVSNMTLTYPSKKGVFDLNFTVSKGEVMGYLGPNGAGKTTTIRALLGFMQPNAGSCTIQGLDCFQQAQEIQQRLGYIPGEITFFDRMNGDEFLQFMHNMRKTKDHVRQEYLLDLFELNPKGKIKKFSKGMKQKLGIVTAFMHDPDILILDEPTSGLDPLMQLRFVDLILEEKKRGKTILMSSHMFEEVEKTCDQVLIIKDGKIIQKSDVSSLKSNQRKGYIIHTQDPHAKPLLEASGYQVSIIQDGQLEVFITGNETDAFIKTISQFSLADLSIKTQTLEDIFMQYYERKEVL